MGICFHWQMITASIRLAAALCGKLPSNVTWNKQSCDHTSLVLDLTDIPESILKNSMNIMIYDMRLLKIL